MAIQLHFTSDVGTTYKRALPKENPGRDRLVSDRPGDTTALPSALNYHGSTTTEMETVMRKPRDFDSELKALADKARLLKERRVRQLGDLVVATGADALDADMLAGALLDAAGMKDAARKEAWRKNGSAFFLGKAGTPAPGSDRNPEGTLPLSGGGASA